MYCASNIPPNANQSSFLTGESLYLQYPPTSISQNMLSTTSYTSSTSSLGTPGQTIFSWAHTVPTYMPWAPKHEQGSNEGLPPVVRFMAPATNGPTDPCTSQTATTWELIHNLGNTCSGVHTANQHLKRRSDIDSDEETTTRPVKQYISEEKMAAKLSQMHISTDGKQQSCKKGFGEVYKSSAKGNMHGPWSTFSEDVSEESESEDCPGTNLEGSLILSPELKEIIQPNPDLVKALLQERTKPSMALVLWQPPGGCIRDKIQSELPSSSAKLCSSNDNSNNNNVTNNMNMNAVPSFIPVTSRIPGSDLLNSTKPFRLPFQPGVPCSSIPQCLDETDDMEL